MSTSKVEVRPQTRTLAAVVIAGTALAPFAIFFGMIARNNAPGFLDPFGLPWPEPLRVIIQVVAVAVVVTAVFAALLGIRVGGAARTAGIVSIPVGVVALAPVLFFLLFVSFGDPA